MSESKTTKKQTFEEHMSEVFKNELQRFFVTPTFERLENAQRHFEKLEIGKRINGKFIPLIEFNFHALKKVLEKALEYSSDEYNRVDNPSSKADYLEAQDRELQNYLEHKWKEAFFLLTPLFLANFYLFDHNAPPSFDKELKEELRRESRLDTPKKRKDACLDYLNQLLLDEEVKHGGRKGFWDEKKRRQFLADYNRFCFVIKNAKNDCKQLRKKRLLDRKIREQIQEKYEIPNECIQDIFLPDSKADIALKWAKRELQIDESNEHLRDRILSRARREEKSGFRSNKSRRIVGFKTRSNGMIDSYYVDLNNPNHGKELRYTLSKWDEEQQ
ncbi:MAG: hypothetical protein LC768_10705 [Acidobacteria bacterium]|nr:hypothetical protein [Acidobacteriota bacterium]MCA1638784.1 hypothetical protein [Acidobacteriota bacterium]